LNGEGEISTQKIPYFLDILKNTFSAQGKGNGHQKHKQPSSFRLIVGKQRKASHLSVLAFIQALSRLPLHFLSPCLLFFLGCSDFIYQMGEFPSRDSQEANLRSFAIPSRARTHVSVRISTASFRQKSWSDI
jgi:hypothetical protein